ncbi:TonB-dependent siderophore receptor [Acinetobacter rathckeae]|uniref:TonB-dependent siderophore receptor n=1 Tax=Acinetobacter rathckeae TaxID=2605272 RepID=UPI0018A24BA5|nr:TonB-dependent receptor [Acinetobacter rathckeae]MBF7688943.1 TonB-dependent receptor [Acinetobacter rathckeae]MBF7696342.1 TonB-dependent receptor [Acinetobacter rathckeae]
MKQWLNLVPLTLLCVTPLAQAEEQKTSQSEDVAVLNSLSFQSESTVKVPYAGKPSSASTKFAIDPMKTPKNVAVVSAKVLQDTNAQRISDTLGVVSGVSVLNPFGGLWDNYSVRGFYTDQTIGASSLRNGINNLGLSASRDMANIQQVEFLKGPEAAMYGAGDPGGTLNVVTKKPKFSPEQEVSARAGSHDQYRVAVGSTDAITDTLAYRLDAAYEKNHSFRDFVKNDRVFVAPQLTWKPSDQTQVNYDSEYSTIHTQFDRGVVAVNNQLGVIPITRFLGQKNDGQLTMKDTLQQLRVEHLWNDAWKSQASFTYKDNSLKGYSTEARLQNVQANGDLNRERRLRDNHSTSYLLNHDALGEFATGSIEHKVVIGTSLSELTLENTLKRYRANSYFINIYNPVYTTTLPEVTGVVSSTKEVQKNAALTLSDYIELDPQWSVLFGGRLDYYKQSLLNKRTNVLGKSNFTHFSPRASVNYLVNDEWSVFASAGQAFHLNSGLDINGQGFDPEKSWSYELGAKAKLLDGLLTSSMSVFHVKKQNVLATNPKDTAFSIANGEEKSRGVELDVAMQPTERLNVKLAYTYTHAKVEKGDYKGARILNSPKNSANVLANYDVWQSGEQKIGLGGNVQYMSSRSGSMADDGFNLPAYTIANLNAYYEASSNLRFQATLNNVFNKTYYASSYAQQWVTPGNPREIFLTVNYKF